MRILCLHGHSQNGEVLRTRIGGLKRKLRALDAELFFADGVHDCELKEGDDLAMKYWFDRDHDTKQATLSSLGKSLDSLDRFTEAHGPFDAVLGFSQGGCMATHLLMARPAMQKTCKTAIIIASPDVDMGGNTIDGVRSLHVMGKADAVVAVAESGSLASKYTGSEKLVHEKGHCLPSAAAFLDKVVAFVGRAKTAAAGDEIGSTSSSYSTAENAILQAEELEVLESIYPDLLTVTRLATGGVAQEPVTICFSLSLDPDDPTSDMCVTLSFNLSPGYPLEEPPHVGIESTLALSEWTGTMQAALRRVMSGAVEMAEVGQTCVFDVIAAAIAWVADGVRCECTDSMATSSAISEGHDESTAVDPSMTEEEVSVYIEDCMLSAGKACSDVTRDHGAGVWRYTVGLVGKPSAGKSTFFNAATRALVERGGRHAAKTSAQPFTTIDPNIALGYIPVYPRPQDVRHVPIIVKDVAGLVPGAYQGRGKGNQFLNDICDADAIVHVVDATGRSDAEGNVLGNGEIGATPAEDCAWIHRELHLWIYGNVIQKFQSVARHSEQRADKARARLIALFTGYQRDSTFLVETACTRAGLDIDSASCWGEKDIHTLVAFYLYLRFPVVIAANKVDGFSDSTKRDSALTALKRYAEPLGMAVVPCSALLDSWYILQNRGSGGGGIDGGGGEETKMQAGDEDLRAKHDTLVDELGSTGVVDALTAAFRVNDTRLIYPVSSLDTEAPIATPMGTLALAVAKGSTVALRDVVVCKPRTTVYGLYEALKRGAISTAVLNGDFVRAEARKIERGDRRVQLSRDAFVGDHGLCVINIMCNRPSRWQQGVGDTH